VNILAQVGAAQRHHAACQPASTHARRVDRVRADAHRGARGLTNAQARRYYPFPVCLVLAHGPASGKQRSSRGPLVVNAAIPLRADAAQEASLQPALRECVARAVRRYLADVESEPAEGLHALVVSEVEAPLLREVMAWYGGNQSRAAAALGINRATLRKKLHHYGLA
jgi:Fis family transcriptional regulator